MPSCIVKSCKNASDKPETRHGFSFHKFPREPILRKKWVTIIRKTRDDENWSPSMHCVVCSAHFEERYLYNTKSGLRRVGRKAVPTKNLFVSTNIPIDIDTSDQCHHLADKTLSSPKSETTCDFDSETKPAADLPTNTCPVPGTCIEYDFPKIYIKVEPLDPSSENVENVTSEENENDIKDKSEKEPTRLPLKMSTRRKLKTLQQKVRRLKKRNTLLKDLLKELLEKHLINVVDTQKLMSENAVLTGLLRSVHTRRTEDNKLVPEATAEHDEDDQS